MIKIFLPIGIVACAAAMFSACGTVQDTTNEDEWINGPPVSMTARLEYRVDSLTNENRRLQQQLDAIQTENKGLAARLTELQTKSPIAPVTTPVVRPTPAPAAKSSLPAAYETALGKYRSRNYDGAIEEFSELLNNGASKDLVDNCHFWIGESYYAMKKYSLAIESYKKATAVSGADKADDAQLMIGNAYIAMGNKAQAKQAYQKLITLYPTSPLAKRAQARMNNL